MKIGQISRVVGNTQRADLLSALAYIIKKYPFFGAAEFSEEPYSYDVYNVQGDIGSANGSRRAIDAAAGSDTFEPSKESGTQRAYSFEFGIDKAYLNDLNVGITAEGLKRQINARQLRNFMRVAYDVLYDMVNGDGVLSNKQILGFKNLIKDVAASSGQTAAFGFTQAEIHASLHQFAMQLDVSDEGVLRVFDEELRKVLGLIEGDPVLVMNPYMAARMTTIAKKLGAYTQGTNDFGMPYEKFGNAAIVPVPLTVLPQTESDGSNSDCSSIYAVEFNEVDGVRYATNTGFEFQNFEWTEAKPSGKTRVDFIGNLKLEDIKKIHRVSRLRL